MESTLTETAHSGQELCTVIICASYFTTGGPGKENRTSKPPPTGSLGKVKRRHHMSDHVPNPYCWHPSWLSNAKWATRKDSQSKWLAKDNLEINPITVKPQTASQVAEQFSWVPFLLLSGKAAFPIKSFAFSARVPPQTITLPVLDKSPLLGPRRGSSPYNNYMSLLCA